MFERRGQFLSWAMEILDPMCAFLSNYEVLSLLIEQKNDRAKVTGFNLYSASKENVQTVEFETIKHLESGPAALLDEDKMTTILSFLKKYDLTRIEKLQILNLLPRNPVEFYALVEECEERFTNDQIDVILNMIDTVVPLPPVPSEPEMAE